MCTEEYSNTYITDNYTLFLGVLLSKCSTVFWRYVWYKEFYIEGLKEPRIGSIKSMLANEATDLHLLSSCLGDGRGSSLSSIVVPTNWKMHCSLLEESLLAPQQIGGQL
jgi:hypothetical protein